MKKQMKHWMLLVSMALTLVACTSSDDMPDVPLAVDDKEFVYDRFIDTSVRPGDDFYRYALGGWLNDENRAPTNLEIAEQALKKVLDDVLTSVSDPVLDGLRSLIAQSMDNDKEDFQLFAERVRRIENIHSQEDLLDVFSELQQLGYQPLLRLAYNPDAAIVKGIIGIGYTPQEIKECMDENDQENMQKFVTLFCERLLPLGYSEERVAELKEHVMDVTLMESKAYTEDIDLLRKQNHFQRRASKRAVDYTTLYQLMGITLSQDEMVENSDPEKQEAIEQLISMLMEGSEESIATVRDYMLYQVVSQDLCFMPKSGLITDEKSILTNALAPVKYYMYRKEAEAFGLDNIHKQECLEIMEEFRTMFRGRIQSLPWMSESTKQEAVKKLQSMKFYIGYPDKWNDAFTPKIEGRTLLQAVTSLRQQALRFTEQVIGTDMQQNGWYCYASLMPFTLKNAMYDEKSNTLVILPVFLISPLFDPTQSDATLYGNAAVFGHEMCHGFDSEGSKRDERGAIRNWWTATDEAAFKDKQQQLIALYNQLEAYPGQKADGEMTLAENMADYAGVTLALECYKQRLMKQGFTGDTYDEQLRKFWLSFAMVWQTTDELDVNNLVYQYFTDNHSANHNRTNGIVRLFDEWYELYDVQPSDRLYLKQEERVKIW